MLPLWCKLSCNRSTCFLNAPVDYCFSKDNFRIFFTIKLQQLMTRVLYQVDWFLFSIWCKYDCIRLYAFVTRTLLFCWFCYDESWYVHATNSQSGSHDNVRVSQSYAHACMVHPRKLLLYKELVFIIYKYCFLEVLINCYHLNKTKTSVNYSCLSLR